MASQWRAEGAGLFVRCLGVDSGEELTVHASRFPSEALPEGLAILKG